MNTEEKNLMGFSYEGTMQKQNKQQQYNQIRKTEQKNKGSAFRTSTKT